MAVEEEFSDGDRAELKRQRQITRNMQQRDRDQTRAERDAYREGQRSREPQTSTARLRVPAPKGETQRSIVGTMAATVVFALFASELGNASGEAKVTHPVTILFGGGVATGLLLLMSEAGDAGAELAQGLAVVALVATMLTTGQPVWRWVTTVVGPHPAAAPTGSTAGTSTGGQPTPVAGATTPASPATNPYLTKGPA